MTNTTAELSKWFDRPNSVSRRITRTSAREGGVLFGALNTGVGSRLSARVWQLISNNCTTLASNLSKATWGGLSVTPFFPMTFNRCVKMGAAFNLFHCFRLMLTRTFSMSFNERVNANGFLRLPTFAFCLRRALSMTGETSR